MKLVIVVPCYNEEEVLAETTVSFLRWWMNCFRTGR